MLQSVDCAALVDALEEPVLAFDGDGSLVGWNRAAAEAAEPDDLVAVAAAELFDGGLPTGGAAADRTVEADLGAGRAYEFTLYPNADDTVVAVGRKQDVSDHRGRGNTLERRERVLRRMHDIIADRDRPFEEQVRALLEVGRKELGTAYGTLSRIRGEEYTFEIVSVDDDTIEEGDVAPTGATNCDIAARTRRTVVLGDVARDAPEATDRAGYTDWNIACYIGAPVYDDDGVYGTFCFYDTEPRDAFSEWQETLVDLMSRWVTYELERQRATERLRRQNEKMERFASMVSHDLRNPLNVLEGYLELAAETGEEEHFERCAAALERMSELIEDLLGLARAGTVVDELEAVPLPELLRECWDTVPTRDATLDIETDRTVEADRGRLKQLVENLFRNSVEHGSTEDRNAKRSEDSVEHGSTGTAGPTTITVGDLPDGFYVADDGVGLPDGTEDDIFETGYSSESGTGLGLAIVAEIADAHNWSVEAGTSAAGGARFEFRGVA